MKNICSKLSAREDFPQKSLLFLSFVLMLVLQIRLLNAGLFWDDDKYIFQNDVIRLGRSPLLFWGREVTSTSWPVFYSLMWALFQLFGLRYALYHCVNLLFHSLNGYLMYRIAVKARLPIPALPAAFFWLHPVTFETAAWIMQFSKILTLTCLLVWCLLYLSSPERISRNFLPLYTACLCSAQPLLILISQIFVEFLALGGWRRLLSLGIQTTLAGYAVFLVVMGATVHYESTIVRLPALPPPAVSAPAAVPPPAIPAPAVTPPPAISAPAATRTSVSEYIAKSALGAGATYGDKLEEWKQKLTHVGQSSLFYFLRIFFPSPQKMPVRQETVDALPLSPWAAVALGALMLLLSIFTLYKRNLFLNLALLSYLPISGIVFIPFQAVFPVADRYLYIPLAFILLFLCKLPREGGKKWWLALSLLCLLPLSYQSFERARYLDKLFHMPLLSMYWDVEP